MSYETGVGSLQQGIRLVTSLSATAPVQSNDSDQAVGSNRLTTTVSHTDQTKLSSTGELVAQTLGDSDVRTAKIAPLQLAIAAGQYSVHSSEVADKLVESLLNR